MEINKYKKKNKGEDNWKRTLVDIFYDKTLSFQDFYY